MHLERSRAGWRREVVAFRVSMRRKMTPSIRRRVQRKLPTLYEAGAELAAASLHEAEPDFRRRLPKTSPYDWAAIESRDVLGEFAEGEPSDRGGA